MFEVRALPQFTGWLAGLKDVTTRAIIVRRIARLEAGLLGDSKTVGERVSELRIDVGPGWRVYYTQRGRRIVILLVGGSKRTQARDIEQAKALAASIND